MKDMLYLISTALVLTALAMPASAQSIENCMFEERTELGSTVNVWDWQAQLQFEVFRSQGTSELILSPFHAVNNVSSPNSDFLLINNDYRPQDGWELLFRTFGSSAYPVDVPTFALYNRYNGRIRVLMFAGPETGAYQTATILWNHKQFTSGLPVETSILEHLNTHMNALDNFEKELEITSLNAYNNPGVGLGNGIWLVADIIAAYDPCTCMNDTYLEFQPKLINTSSISLNITGTIETTPVIENGTVNSSSNDIFNLSTKLGSSASTVMNKGLATYKTFNDFESKIHQLLVALDLLCVPPPNATESACAGKGIVKLPSYLSGLGAVTAGLTMIDFLVNGGSSSTPSSPTSYSSAVNLTASGTLAQSDPYTSFTMAIPGADHNPNLPQYTPIYDNVLGIFNLLETPKIAKAWDFDDVTGKRYFYKPVGDIKYAINPHAKLAAPVELKGAFYFETSSEGTSLSGPEVFSGAIHVLSIDQPTVKKKIYRTPFIPLGCLDDYTVYFKNSTFMGYNPVITFEIIAVMPRQDGLGEEVLFASRYKVSTVGFEQPFPFPWNPYNPYWDIPENLIVPPGTISGNTSLRAWNAIYLDLNEVTIQGNLSLYATQIFINGDIPTELLPFGEYNADIDIDGDGDVDKKDGNWFIYDPASNVGVPMFTGSIHPVTGLPFCEFVPQQTKSQVITFCNDKDKYNPIVALIQSQPNDQTSLSEETVSKLWPTLTDGNVVNISLNTHAGLGEWKVILTNSWGNTLETHQGHAIDDTTLHQLDLAAYPAGMYFVQVLYNGHREVHKVMKVK